MSTKIELTYCGMSGTGETVKAAKADAARKIESLIGDDGLWRAPGYTPQRNIYALRRIILASYTTINCHR